MLSKVEREVERGTLRDVPLYFPFNILKSYVANHVIRSHRELLSLMHGGDSLLVSEYLTRDARRRNCGKLGWVVRYSVQEKGVSLSHMGTKE